MRKSRWEFLKEGDTYIYQIKNYSEEYNGRYLVFIKCSPLEFDTNKYINLKYGKYPVFRVKITKDNVKPKTREEVENLEYCKICATHFIERFLPHTDDEKLIARRSKQKFYPDEYNFLYSYLMSLACTKKFFLENFEYLGNFELSTPTEEFFRYDEVSLIRNMYWKYFEKTILNSYIDYNLKKGAIYTEEGNKRAEESAKMIMSGLEYFEKYIKKK